MGVDGPKPAGPEQTNEELANALEVESEYLPKACESLMENEEQETAGYMHLLMLDLPEVIKRLRED